MESLIVIQDYLIKYGIKPSIQRLAIMDYLFSHRTHPTADEIYSALYREFPTLSKTTVYNTLKLFADRGAILSLVIDKKNVRYDADISEHAHFQCLKCGRIFDLPAKNGLEQVEERSRFRITEIHIYYKGYCNECNQLLNKAKN